MVPVSLSSGASLYSGSPAQGKLRHTADIRGSVARNSRGRSLVVG